MEEKEFCIEELKSPNDREGKKKYDGVVGDVCGKRVSGLSANHGSLSRSLRNSKVARLKVGRDAEVDG